jgi:hypothetical protein
VVFWVVELWNLANVYQRFGGNFRVEISWWLIGSGLYKPVRKMVTGH